MGFRKEPQEVSLLKWVALLRGAILGEPLLKGNNGRFNLEAQKLLLMGLEKLVGDQNGDPFWWVGLRISMRPV